MGFSSPGSMDFPWFLSGLGFILLASIARAVARRDAGLQANRLAMFALLAGIADLASLFSPALDDPSPVRIVRAAFLVTAYFGLLAFARQGLRLRNWILTVPLAAALLGMLVKSRDTTAVLELALGLPATLAAGLLIVREGRRRGRSGTYLMAAGYGVWALGLVRTLSSLLGSDPFPGAIAPDGYAPAGGALAHLLATALIGATAAMLRLHYGTLCRSDTTRTRVFRESWLFAALIPVMVLGWLSTQLVEHGRDRDLRLQLLAQARTAAAILDPAQVKTIAEHPDEPEPAVLAALRARLASARAATPGCRFAYLLARREAGVIFLGDSEPMDSPDYSPPGSPYNEASPDLIRELHAGTGFTEGPSLDAWGTWVSALAPVRDPETGQVLALLGFDIDARDWNALLARVRMLPILLTLSLSLLLLMLLAAELSSAEATDRIVESEQRYRSMFEDNVSVMLLIEPSGGRILGANEAAVTFYGWPRGVLLAKSFAELNVSPGESQLLEADAPARDGRQALLLRHQVASGEVRNVEAHLMRLSRDGRDVIFAILHDITERSRVETALRESEEWTRSITSAALDAIVVIDGRGKVTFWNEAAARVFGWEPAEILGRDLHTVIAPGHSRDSHVQEMDAFRTSGQGEITGRVREMEGLRRDGTVFPVELSISPLRRNGEWWAVAVIRDTTERNRAAERQRELMAFQAVLAALRGVRPEESERTLWQVFLGTLIQHYEMAGGWYGLNEGATVKPLVTFGRTAGWKDDLVIDLAGPDISRECFLVGRALQEGRPLGSEELKTGPDVANGGVSPEETIPEPTLAVPVLIDGRPEGCLVVLGSSTDAFNPARTRQLATLVGEIAGSISDRRRRRSAEMALISARDEARNAARAKSDFLATMSHEIRTPMNGVIGMTELLLETALNEEQREYAGIIRHSGESLLSIINDILDFSKIEAGHFELENQDFDLRALLEETAETLAARAHAKGLELICVIPPGIPTSLCGAGGRVRQVMTNLLGNAVKFTESGEIFIESTLLAESPTSVRIRLAVRDTGIGIPLDKQDVIFDSFTQADSSTTRRYGGTGLGLAISRRLVEMMGGRIGLTSQPGRGSTFYADLPLEKAAADSEPDLPLPRAARVLVVDDNESFRDYLRTELMTFGLRPETATEYDALELLLAARNTDPFDVVLLDQAMPEMDGEMISQAMLADPRLANLPRILLGVSTPGSHRSAGALRAMGFSSAIMKPVRREQLRQGLESALRAERPAVPKEAGSSLPARPAFAGVRVLLVEDNSVNQRVALRMLNRLGILADTADDGREALALLAARRYDFVLMDCQMPELDGYEATEAWRRLEIGTGVRLPIVAMTANAMEGDRERCLACGMDDYLPKPVRVEELRLKLERWVLDPETTSEPEDGEGLSRAA